MKASSSSTASASAGRAGVYFQMADVYEKDSGRRAAKHLESYSSSGARRAASIARSSLTSGSARCGRPVREGVRGRACLEIKRVTATVARRSCRPQQEAQEGKKLHEKCARSAARHEVEDRPVRFVPRPSRPRRRSTSGVLKIWNKGAAASKITARTSRRARVAPTPSRGGLLHREVQYENFLRIKFPRASTSSSVELRHAQERRSRRRRPRSRPRSSRPTRPEGQALERADAVLESSA